MRRAFVQQTTRELRHQASKLYAIAAHVCRRDVADRLQEHAARLLVEAELRSPADRD